MNVIETQDLRRTYRAKTGVLRHKVKELVAVDGIDLSVARGELFGLVGPNGAGKTTTVKMLSTVLTPTGGQARVLGYDIVQQMNEIRPRIGFVFGGERGLYWRLSGYDNLSYFASLYYVPTNVQRQRIPYLLELVGLGERAEERVQGYSRGIKQRLHIARALLHDPQVLFLDEPTMGLDPVGARELRQAIRELLREEKTILLTTHYMLEAESLCHRVAVINHGKIAALDTPAGLRRHVRDLSVIEVEVLGIPPEAVSHIEELDGVRLASVESQNQRQVLRVQSDSGAATVAPIVSRLEEMGLTVGNVAVREPTLEDAYVRLVGGDR
jgi:ABC-2 type transport system ATP-binding protein